MYKHCGYKDVPLGTVVYQVGFPDACKVLHSTISNPPMYFIKFYSGRQVSCLNYLTNYKTIMKMQTIDEDKIEKFMYYCECYGMPFECARIHNHVVYSGPT